MALITRTLESTDGAQQIAIFDTAQKPVDSELGLFTDNEKEFIAPKNKEDAMNIIGKLIFIGKKI
ncbi:hypothetical protein [Shewanella sp. SM21]|uniref:hypothetical protein n=1 Tax=Shewanella sp. SM21 TaxID=2912793 RepID=UPI0021D9571D|nr:hypothetical protein [Shewanella sp. SM21]MCU8086860.1 hypothetical protein [Shewanella sp. SM21]